VKKTANKNQRGLYCSQETVQMIGLGWLVCLFVVVVVVFLLFSPVFCLSTATFTGEIKSIHIHSRWSQSWGGVPLQSFRFIMCDGLVKIG